MDHAHFFKGVPVLLSALPLCSDFSAVLAGDGVLKGEYERQARSLDSRARFVGAVSRAELIRLYQRAAVTVLPSTTAGEAFGLVLLESLACGTPVVASDLPGVRTVVDHERDGLLVPPGDPMALAAALSRLGGDPDWRQAMGAAGRRKVEARYRWERIGERLEQIYTEVLGQAATASGRAACAS
jgi:glycosyltransferase involved in cell wall biosynthesis